MEIVSKKKIEDAKILFFNRILNTDSNRSSKCGPRQLNLNFSKFFLHNGLNNIFLDLVVYLLIGFRV